MSEPWSEVAASIALALAAAERLLERDEDWRALGQLEAREAAGERLQAAEGAVVKARLQESLAARPAYRIRERLIEVRRLVDGRDGAHGVAAPRPSQETPANGVAARPIAPADDLTRVRGIDPRLATELARMGVQGYAAIASWGAEDVRRVSDALGLGRRISRENWIEQAALLVARRGAALPVAAQSGTPLECEAAPVRSSSPAGDGAKSRLRPVDAGGDQPVMPLRALEGVGALSSSAPSRPRDVLTLEAVIASSSASVTADRLGRGAGPVDGVVAAEPPAPPAPMMRVPDSPSVPLLPVGAGGPHAAGAAAPDPVAAPAERAPLQCAALFAAPLSAVVPFIGPEVRSGRTIAVPLKGPPEPLGARPRELEARPVEAAGPRPAPPPPSQTPVRASRPREVLGARIAAPARVVQPSPAPRTRSEWSASEATVDVQPAAVAIGVEADVEIVQKAPGERPLSRPEPRGRLPKRAEPERLAAPRAVLMDVEAAEVVIVPHGGEQTATQAPHAATTARDRLDVSRIIAGWRGR